jgi:hypothetical protein
MALRMASRSVAKQWVQLGTEWREDIGRKEKEAAEARDPEMHVATEEVEPQVGTSSASEDEERKSSETSSADDLRPEQLDIPTDDKKPEAESIKAGARFTAKEREQARRKAATQQRMKKKIT